MCAGRANMWLTQGKDTKKGDATMSRTNEELVKAIQETGDEAAYKELFHNIRPIIIHEAEMYKGKIPHYGLEDYIQEGNLLAWKIIFSGNFKGGSFAVYFGKAIRNYLCRIFRDYSMKNLICIGQKEDDHGNVTSILVEAEYAQKYREKQRERNKRYYERKKAEEAEARRLAGIPEPVKKQPMTKEEKIARQVAWQKEYYKANPDKLKEVKNSSGSTRTPRRANITTTQGCKLSDKFRVNSFIVIPAAVVILIVYYFMGANIQAAHQTVTVE